MKGAEMPKKPGNRSGRSGKRPGFKQGGKVISWVCLRYPPALDGCPSYGELSGYCNRLNYGQTFHFGKDLPPSLRELFWVNQTQYSHSANTIFLVVSIWQHLSFGFYPPLRAWNWLIVALRQFWYSRNSQPRNVDLALKLNKPAELFQQYQLYRQREVVMWRLHMNVMTGASVSQSVNRVLNDCGPVQGMTTVEKLRQRYYKEEWPHYFEEALKCYHGGGNSCFSSLWGAVPDNEIVARYPCDDAIHNAWKSSDSMLALASQQPYCPVQDVSGYEDTILTLNRWINDQDPLAALEIFLWFDSRGMYPPGIILHWLMKACQVFLLSSGAMRFSEALGFRSGVNPWKYTQTDFFKSVLALQALVGERCGMSISDIAKHQYERSESVPNYFPLRDPEKLRQNVYAYREKLEKDGVLHSALEHSDEYIKHFR